MENIIITLILFAPIIIISIGIAASIWNDGDDHDNF